MLKQEFVNANQIIDLTYNTILLAEYSGEACGKRLYFNQLARQYELCESTFGKEKLVKWGKNAHELTLAYNQHCTE
jgi:hypothetical protein